MKIFGETHSRLDGGAWTPPLPLHTQFSLFGEKKKKQTLTITQRCCSRSHYLWIFPAPPPRCGINQEIYAKLDLFPTLFMGEGFPFSRTVVINYVPTGNPGLPGARRVSVLKSDEMLEDVIRLEN